MVVSHDISSTSQQETKSVLTLKPLGGEEATSTILANASQSAAAHPAEYRHELHVRLLLMMALLMDFEVLHQQPFPLQLRDESQLTKIGDNVVLKTAGRS